MDGIDSKTLLVALTVLVAVGLQACWIWNVRRRAKMTPDEREADDAAAKRDGFYW